MGPTPGVQEELAALRAAAASTSVEELQDGSWLLPVVREALDPYGRQTDRVALAWRHQLDLDATEELAEACIAWAQRRALLAGGLSASAFASVVMGTLVSGGFAAVLAVPTALIAFTVDCWYTARVQLQLAWDLAVLYDHPVALDDEAQLLALCRLAFGIEADQEVQAVLTGIAPEASRLGTRVVTAGSRVAYHAALRAMGQTLVQRGLARFAVPAVGVPMCAAVNHVTTGRTGRTAQQLLRGHARARDLAGELGDELAATPTLVLALLLWMTRADERARGAEVTLVRRLAGDVPEAVGLAEALHRSEGELLAQVAAAPAVLREALYEAGIRAAALDGVLHSEEDRRLRELATACGVRFDARRVSEAILAARSG
jgi:hypothetical protein